MKAVVTSDFHVDAVTAGFDRGDDVRVAVRQIVQHAIDTKADTFLFLGDLCDPDASRAPRCAAFAIEVAELLGRHGIDSFWMVGNHDVIEDGSGTSTLEPLVAVGAAFKTMVFTRPQAVLWGTVAFVALPYVPRVAAYDPVEFIETCQVYDAETVIVLSHLNCPGIVPASETHEMPRGREVWLPLEAIAKRWPTPGQAIVLQGHYHRQQALPDWKTPKLMIPGNVARLTFGEADHAPGWFDLAINKGKVKATPHTLPARALVTIGADSPLWKGDGGHDTGARTGDIVRLQPPADVADGVILDVIDKAKKFAAAVKYTGRAVADDDVARDVVTDAVQAPRRTVREVVAELVGDRAALGEFCDDTMAKEGL